MNKVIIQLEKIYGCDKVFAKIAKRIDPNRTPCSLLLGVEEETWERIYFGEIDVPATVLVSAKNLLFMTKTQVLDELLDKENEAGHSETWNRSKGSIR